MSTLKKFAGQTAIYGLSTIVARLLNYLLTPIYTRVYPVQVFGILTTMYAWVSILNPILAFGMETTFFRYLNKHDDKQKVYSNTFFTTLFIALFFLIVILAFIDPLAAWLHGGSKIDPENYKAFIKMFAAILVLDAIAVVPFAKVRADGRPGRYSVIKFTNILIAVAFNLIFLFVIPWLIRQQVAPELFSWFKGRWVGYVFLSNLIASFVTLLMLLPELLKLKFRYDFALLREMLVYSFPVLIANLSFIINETSDKIFIRKLLGGDFGEQEVGIYGAVAKLAIFLSIFIQAFRLGAEPFFFSHAKEKNSGATYAVIMDYFVIALSIIFVALVANVEILKYFVDGGTPEQRGLFWSGLKVVPILLFAYVSLGIYMNLSVWYKLSDQTRFGLYISGVGALITVVLNIIFIPKYSYYASAWITLLAYTCMMVLSYLWGQKRYPIPYNIKKNLAYLLTAIGFVFLSFVVFDRNLIIGNLLLLFFAAGSFYFERKNLKSILSSK
ncbi:lipopolysaccharide biosynthesis protein [Pedobacter sp. SYSU D00535]|uniref:lipopolysaccharide biosynthesis protein n=1 Tax=Pedobacter sp. SYSU D00535 TaxID=2810308 RepID=UPI001A95E63B|nr:oligosaccharide flippase family protein [Pedobacter sp. SYSU D00535]